MVAQSTVNRKIDFVVELITEAANLFAIVLDVIVLLYGLFLPWPLDNAE
jgi:hypothetical protein